MVTFTSSQFGPPRTLATRTRTLPVCVPIVNTPVAESMVHPCAAPWMEKCTLADDGKTVALIWTVFVVPPEDGAIVAGDATAFVTPVVLPLS